LRGKSAPRGFDANPPVSIQIDASTRGDRCFDALGEAFVDAIRCFQELGDG
jgi:hypothetical protein